MFKFSELITQLYILLLRSIYFHITKYHPVEKLKFNVMLYLPSINDEGKLQTVFGYVCIKLLGPLSKMWLYIWVIDEILKYSVQRSFTTILLSVLTIHYLLHVFTIFIRTWTFLFSRRNLRGILNFAVHLFVRLSVRLCVRVFCVTLYCMNGFPYNLAEVFGISWRSDRRKNHTPLKVTHAV